MCFGLISIVLSVVQERLVLYASVGTHGKDTFRAISEL